jgi:hypothetical protein
VFAYRIICIFFLSVIVFGVIVFGLGQFSLGQLFNTSISAVQLLALIYLAVAIFLIYLGIVYYKFRYVVRRDGLQIILFPFKLTIYYDTIYEIDLRPSKKVEGPPGWGLRIWGNSMFATTGAKPCLYIKRMEGIVSEFYLSSGDPENLVSRIKINMKKYFAPRKT